MASSSMASSSSRKIFLKSSDGEKFEVAESVARQSQTINHMMDDLGDDNDTIPLPNVSGKTLSKVLEYSKILEYCKKHDTAQHDEPTKTEDGTTTTSGDKKEKENLEQWDKEFLQPLDLNFIFEILLAANYMDIKSLLDICAQHVADSIKDKSVEEVRTIFGITNDFTPEEEDKIRKDNAWAFE